jgi:hypothetical protein
VANDNKATTGVAQIEQLWEFKQLGVTSSAAPFGTTALDNRVAAGRAYSHWQAQFGANTLCMAYQGGHLIMSTCTASGTEWVLSGSGRIISVLSSNTQGTLEFLRSSGVNSGHPSFTTATDCPASCWGPNAG